MVAAAVLNPNGAKATKAEEKVDELNEQIEGYLGDLAHQLALGHTAEFMNMLDWHARLHRYSIGNSILIRKQNPKATVLAGYKRWSSLGFSVRKGEKGIAIRAPMLRRHVDESTGEITQRLTGYWPTYIWDITQTNEYPTKQPPTIYKPVPGDWDELYQQLKLQAILHDVIVTEEPMPHGIHGMYWDGRICINQTLETFYRIGCLIHEYCHWVAHGTPEKREGLTRNQREWEAEQVCYVVCRMLHIDHETARDYLLAYSYTTEDLASSIKRTQQLVKQVCAELDILQEIKEAS